MINLWLKKMSSYIFIRRRGCVRCGKMFFKNIFPSPVNRFEKAVHRALACIDLVQSGKLFEDSDNCLIIETVN